MAAPEELTTLLALRRRLLLELTDLVEQLSRYPYGRVASPEYEQVLTTLQKAWHTGDQVFEMSPDLLPYLRQDVRALGRHAEVLRGILAGLASSVRSRLPEVG
ncbi:hypothetical protein DAERI_110023 [Deinococcus aerius]|uniref:Uncharacterized protein n=1 Tax=Deinococcus aerius TaxID=200253 RepID=A0A2I9DNZ1_9DEIO|nr:hypothetical protein [Deinococcus aerius]GBF06841.1 hypothetical protein DAERI_110023 [Deinococcus aerius]